jgi:Zn-finger nucleic acid-binding protein
VKCPKCGAPLQTIQLDAGASVLSCSGCSGAFYSRNELAVEIALSNVKETDMACPACAARLRTGTMYDGKLELDQCVNCMGVWLDAGEIVKLRSLSGVEGILKTSAAAFLPPEIPNLRPAMTKNRKSDDEPVPASHGGKLADSGTMSNSDASRAPTITVDGVVYKHFQTSVAQVTCALGEFTWKVAVGEQARTRDFIAPPLLLSNEVTSADSVWTKGRYLEGSEVWAAFGMDGSPPHQTKVAPAQPNPWESGFDGVKTTFWIGVILSLIAAMVLHMRAAEKTILTVPFVYDRAEAEKSKVSPEFTLDGRTSNVELVTDTNIDNHWAYITMALINTETDEAFDFGREVSYYHGSDSDGPWTEGAPYDRAIVPSVPAGHYYLRVEPEDGDLQNFVYRITIRRDVPQIAPLFVALAALLLPFIFIYWRRYAFEVSRWSESDHPWVSDSSDDDD